MSSVALHKSAVTYFKMITYLPAMDRRWQNPKELQGIFTLEQSEVQVLSGTCCRPQATKVGLFIVWSTTLHLQGTSEARGTGLCSLTLLQRVLFIMKYRK